MPNPSSYDNESDFMTACIPVVMDEGKTRDQAIGKCQGIWNNKNMAETFEPPPSKNLPDKAKEILKSAYSSCRLQWVKDNPSDKENKSNKEKCARIAWSAVKNAGYSIEGEYMEYQEGQETITQPTEQPAPQKKKSKIEILADIKKMLEKNGLTISDDVLLGLVDSMQIQGMTLSRRLEVYEFQKLSPVNTTQKILVFPRGKHWIEQYKEWLVYDDSFYSDVEKNFKDTKLNKPYIDKDHEYAESFGDILDYEINEDGMYFFIRLNEYGIDLVKKGIYRYISPSFGNVTDTTKKQHKNWMVTISLTNNPAFLGVIPALQEQIKLNRKTEVKKMDGLKKLANYLELQEEASQDAIMQAVMTIKEQLTAALETINKLSGESAQKDEQIEEQQTAMSKLTQEIKELNDVRLAKEWEEVIQKAVEGGYPTAEEIVELKKKEFFKDSEKVKKELSYFNNKSQSQLTSKSNVISELKLTEDEKNELKELGIDYTKDENKDIIIKAGYGEVK